MNCLSRSDPDKEIFERPIYAKDRKRTNYFNLLKVIDNKLVCESQTYSLENICQNPNTEISLPDKHPCKLPTGEVIEIHPTFSFTPDLCFDNSFWKYPDRCSNKDNSTFAIRCMKNTFDCTKNQSNYCPYTSNSNSCQSEHEFYCDESETCIAKGRYIKHDFHSSILICFTMYLYFVDKMCDGISHCLNHEDEKYETCKDKFPEEATIECIADKMDGIDLKIRAIPCDGIRECRSGEDEDCQPSEIIVYSLLIVLYFITVLIWCWIRYDVQKNPELEDDDSEDLYQNIDCRSLMGDQLAEMKVSYHQCSYGTVHLHFKSNII